MFKVGDLVRLNPSIKKRPSYFHAGGMMDWLLTGQHFRIAWFDKVKDEYVVVEREGPSRLGTPNIWHVKKSDVVLAYPDNRRVAGYV